MRKIQRLNNTRLRSFSGALRALQFCEALACGASEVRKLGEEVEKSFAKLDDTIHTIAVHTAQNVHTQHAYSCTRTCRYRHCILVPVVESTCTCMYMNHSSVVFYLPSTVPRSSYI